MYLKKINLSIKILFSMFILIIFLFSECKVLTKTSDNIYLTAQDIDIKNHLGLNKSEYKKFTGKNTTVAILDSGVMLHNDIDKNRIVGFKDFVNNIQSPYDDNGHGTFVAGIIGANGKLKGIAPDTKFLIIKVLDKDGETNQTTICNALDWLIKNKELYNIKVVNMSFGVFSALSAKEDPVCQLISKLKHLDTLIFCAAGNMGPSENTILSPGISPDVITVGSLKHNYDDKNHVEVDNFSGRGSQDNGIYKPNLVTLGTDIISLDFNNKNGYTKKSGTSFSTAIMSGIACILLEKFNNIPIDKVEKFMTTHTHKLKKTSEDSQGLGEFGLTSDASTYP